MEYSATHKDFHNRSDSEDSQDEVPLQHKRPFAQGLRRKPISFVPAASGQSAGSELSRPPAPSQSVADLYLDLVLPKEPKAVSLDSALPQMCEVCQLPLEEIPADDRREGHQSTRRHEASIAHQVCLAHSHPPSAVDRSRMGLAVLQAQGWNPDSRNGLGIAQQGVQYPIKIVEKNDTLGIGVKIPKDIEARKKEKVQKLDAGKVRKMAAEDKKRRERLHQQFYGNGELEKYLGIK
ncbi:hypothetical protein BX600DRAFT_504954 [Xylariales sp. PMI_506]|nr:hypothetical protein BX600DRAFT_504954 [Xylariales sp. PMI_506]